MLNYAHIYLASIMLKIMYNSPWPSVYVWACECICYCTLHIFPHQRYV